MRLWLGGIGVPAKEMKAHGLGFINIVCTYIHVHVHIHLYISVHVCTEVARATEVQIHPAMRSICRS